MKKVNLDTYQKRNKIQLFSYSIFLELIETKKMDRKLNENLLSHTKKNYYFNKDKSSIFNLLSKATLEKFNKSLHTHHFTQNQFVLQPVSVNYRNILSQEITNSHLVNEPLLTTTSRELILNNNQSIQNSTKSTGSFIDIRNEFIKFLKNKFLTTAAPSIDNQSDYTKYPNLSNNRKLFRNNDSDVTFFKYNRNHEAEIVNIWKLAFFLLLFILGFITLLVVLTLTIKLIL
jgi:hypothetical protein